MTDDKGAEEGMQAQAGICKRCFDDHEGDDCVGNARSQGLIDGRKAERERCLKIVNDFCPCHDDIVQIEKRIREG